MTSIEPDGADGGLDRAITRWPRDTPAAFVVLGTVLALGVPPFLRMGLWPDSTLYDMAARTVMRGGVHYRDVFDTNFPGMMWAHLAIRALFGFRFEALRAVDLAIGGAIVACLGRLVVLMGGTIAAAAWLSVASTGFYLSAPEIYHCQRDVWMLLPALVALQLRLRTLRQSDADAEPLRTTAARSLAEGVCWSAAIWIKPVAIMPALACVDVAWRLAHPVGAAASRRRRVDAVSLVAGASIAAAAGLLWLWRSGTWPYFLDVMLNWTPEYAAPGYGLFLRRLMIRLVFNLGRPWTFAHVAAVPLAIAALWRSRLNGRTDHRDAAALTAACYLGWFIQAWFLQPRVHPYVMLPTTLLAGPMIVGMWKPRGRQSALLALAAVVPLLFQPLVSPTRLAVWFRCFVESSPALRDRLSLSPQMMVGSANWTDLDRVASFLRGQHVADGELLCFSEVPHVLYLDLDLRPPVRYMQFNLLVDGLASHRAEVLRELSAAHPRFVVSDLVSIGARPDALQPPPFWRTRYPWNLPVVFRAGRYVVHTPTMPATSFWR